jgi:hypothetical protein
VLGPSARCSGGDTSSSSPRPEGGEWLALPEARRQLGVISQEVVKAWVDFGWLRGRSGPGGRLEVLRDDILLLEQEHEGLTAIGGDELTSRELEDLAADQPGTVPWRRVGADASQ